MGRLCEAKVGEEWKTIEMKDLKDRDTLRLLYWGIYYSPDGYTIIGRVI